ncbi:MAG: iron-containing alcohol dehydrogenase [Desulfamplus sp.]|nr:iron-containing alcohol dehydrogenase [Desulfamplus sp.]
MNFSFFSPVEIIFGQGVSKNIAGYIPSLYSKNKNIVCSDFASKFEVKTKSKIEKALVITGKNKGRAGEVINSLKRSGISCELFVQPSEPSIDDIINGVELARKSEVDFVVAIGGGSVIDAGKAIAALTTNTDNIMKYLEVIGDGVPLSEKPLPMIAIPTTSGTGAEVTSNAVISSDKHQVKVSLRSNMMYPDIAIIDPELTIFASPEITATTGMDALTQLIESFTSKFANPITDALSQEGIRRVARSFKKAYSEPLNIEARSDMSFAAMLSGITLSNAKLGAVHGIAGPMGGMVNAPHGLLCASLLGPVISANVRVANDIAINQNQNNLVNNHVSSNQEFQIIGEDIKITLNKYSKIAQILTNNTGLVECNDLINYINELLHHLKIKEISSKALPKFELSQIELIAQKSKDSSSMKGNPVTLSFNQIKNIIEQSFFSKI